jgi:hypothetical protein
MTLICVSKDEDAALSLIKLNVADVSKLEWIKYGGIGKVGERFTPPESIWNEIVVFLTERRDDGVANRYARQALAGLLQCYQHLTAHQKATAEGL